MRTTKSQKVPQLAGIAAVAVGALALAGCSGSGTPEATGGVEDSSISIMIQNGLVPQFEKYAAAYTEAHPDRTVEVQSAPDDGAQYAQQLVTARLSGGLADIVMNIDFISDRLAAGNVTYDLTDWLESGVDGLTVDSFTPNFLGQYRPLSAPDSITGLPVSADAVTLFYNKSLFEQAGVTEYPEADWTWEDLYRVGAELQAGSGGQFFGLQAPLNNGGHAHIFTPVIVANGGYVYDPDTGKVGIGEPEAIKAWELLLKPYGTASAPYDANPASLPNFANGQVAMAFQVRAAVPSVKDSLGDADWDVQTLPQINGESTAGGGSYGLSITQSSENKEAAQAFLGWFFSEDGGMKLAQESGQVVPPTVDGLDGGIWRDVPAPPANQEAFAEAAKTAVLQTQLPGQGGTVLNDAVTLAMQQVLLEHRDIAEAFEEAAATVQQAVDAER